MNEKTLATFRIDKQLWKNFQDAAKQRNANASVALIEWITAFMDGGLGLDSENPGIDKTPSTSIDNSNDCLDKTIQTAIAPLQERLDRLEAELEKFAA